MAATMIKIISDPYRQSVSFQVWDMEWKTIDATTDPNSMLLGDDIAKGFFPFKAEEIVRTVIDEYWVGDEPLRLVFEGTDDEYAELRELCELDGFRDRVAPERSGRRLSNACDILPEVRGILGRLGEVMGADGLAAGDSPEILERLFSGFDNCVPICVMGNYSSGKSTFINALIGREILPTGDEPITARIYELRDSHDASMSSIEFEYGGEHVHLQFGQDGIDCGGCEAPERLLNEIRVALDEVYEPSLVAHMNAVLGYANGLEDVSDNIRILVPFAHDGVWEQGQEFVIFDTPGSNSASNSDHSRVLRKAMGGLTNGLPIYVAEYSTLDSTDNASLFDQIATIDALDERFAIIVANKADAADINLRAFDDQKRRLVLDWAIPRSLYAQGIFFVSSLMGLGSKIDGDFISDSCAEKYEDQERKYSNPKSRFYKSLYRFDIMPAQLEARAISESEDCTDLVLANSGLYCVERAIERFASRYSAYNKCWVAERGIAEALELLRSSLVSDRESLERTRDSESQLIASRADDLSNSLDACAQSISSDVASRYTLYAEKKTTCMRWLTSAHKLQGAYEEPGLSSKETLERIQSGFTSAIESMMDVVGDISRSFLEEEEAEARDKLCSLAVGSAETPDEVRREISRLILDFPALDGSGIGNVKFDMRDFERRFTILFLTLGKRGEIDFQKLAAAYNGEIRKAFKQVVELIRDSHRPSFVAWLNGLCEMIKGNIVRYNVDLRDRQESIDAIDSRLKRSAIQLNALDTCSREIEGLTSWRDESR